MIKILLNAETEQLAPYLDAHLLTYIRNGQVNKYECFREASVISFDWYDIHNVDGALEKVAICFTHEHIFFICQGDSGLSRVRKMVGEEKSDDRVLYVFFSELIKGDIDYLEELEERITENEDQVISNYKSYKREYSGEIIALRRELLKLKRYYEQLNNIFEGLMANENKLISPENLRYFRILDSRIDRLFAHVLNLRDYVTQVREAYQAQVDIEQNNLMRIFTVVTSIFLPLTLIVGWYGMNIKMPEFQWTHAYPFVAGLCVLVTAVLLIVFKKRKWF
jgi:magnesium transporter